MITDPLVENMANEFSMSNIDDFTKSTFFGHDALNSAGELNEDGKFWLSGLAGMNLKASISDEGEQQLNINQEENLLDQNPEFQKLGLLNSHLNNEMISKSEKIMLIYHQILEELHEGCCRNQNIMNQEEKIERAVKQNTLASGTISTL